MTRRIASKVLQQTSRLLEAKLIKDRPAWFQAVIDNPPLPLPPRAPPQRNQYDLPVPKSSTHHSPTAHHTPSKHLRTPKPRPLPVHYIEDDLRRQFFKDHPFEAFRPVSLAEQGQIEEENPINGEEWTRLRQHGRNPTPEEYVCFDINKGLYVLSTFYPQCHSLRGASAQGAPKAAFRRLQNGCAAV